MSGIIHLLLKCCGYLVEFLEWNEVEYTPGVLLEYLVTALYYLRYFQQGYTTFRTHIHYPDIRAIKHIYGGIACSNHYSRYFGVEYCYCGVEY